jgi:type IV secretion system protein VirB9
MKSALFAFAYLLQAPFSYQPDNEKLTEIEYRPNRVIPITAALGFQVTVLLSPDEQIKTIAVGDSTAWQVTANQSANNIFIKLTESGQTTNMTVVTNVRLYAFELVPLEYPPANMPYIVRLTYPSTVVADETINPTEILGRYKLTGSKSLRPSGIADDGQRTFIEWPERADIPAVFGLDQAGHEILVNGMMRDDRLVIDSVVSTLIFRIDEKVARATRNAVEKHR